MVQYRRNLVEGGTYFFTVTLINRDSDILTQHIDALRTSVAQVQQTQPFEIVAWVVLPDHLHAAVGDCDYSSRWRAIKSHYSYFTKQSHCLCCHSVFNTESSDFKTLDTDFRRYDDFMRLGIASDYLKELLYVRSLKRQGVSIKMRTDGAALLWQRRFWEHTIKDEDDLRRCVDYCYINPVKYGLVNAVVDWPYSSFHRDIKRGVYPSDWAGDGDENVDGFGEPLITVTSM